VKVNQAVHAISTMSRVLEVSRSGYYAWLSREPSERAKLDAKLIVEIHRSHEASRGTYGAPRVLVDLAEAGYGVSKKRVARLMRTAGLEGVSRRRKRTTTVRDPQARPAEDLVDRDFTASGPDELWVADITYVSTLVGHLYLAVVLDAWSRRVVGWSMQDHLRTSSSSTPLTWPPLDVRPTRSSTTRTRAAWLGRWPSARVALSWECSRRWVQWATRTTTMCESFFARSNASCSTACASATTQRPMLPSSISSRGFYNSRRRHSALDYLSPALYERVHAQAA
jgi:putative transposase